MKAYVYVSLKKSVLDPQGKTIQGALKKMGYKGLEDVRQGKYFELTLDGEDLWAYDPFAQSSWSSASR